MHSTPPSIRAILPAAQEEAPLILIIEHNKEYRKTIIELFAQAHCQIMLVETHAQAADLAPVLPFSAILLNATLNDSGEDIVRRLRYLAEDGLMPTVPLWIMLDKLSFIETDYWQQRGISQLLLRPLSLPVLLCLKNTLYVPDHYFYQHYDRSVRNDLPSEILASMPMMNRMLAAQVALIEPVVEAFARGQEPPPVVEEAHAVKSAALTLGYFRLAALMDHIEHAAGAHLFMAYPANWAIIAHVLRMIEFET